MVIGVRADSGIQLAATVLERKRLQKQKKLLQRAIGFGSILVYYEDVNPETCALAKHGECFKEESEGVRFRLVPVTHATQKQKC